MGSAFIKSTSGLLGLVAAGFITTASAADLPSRALTTLPPPAAVPVWGGLYFGINLGYGDDKFTYPFAVNASGLTQTTVNASLSTTGILGGGQVGYNFAFPHFGLPYDGGVVLGVEADDDAASIAGNVQLFAVSPGGGTSGGGYVGSRISSLGTARGRLGLAFGRFLIFGTGGFAFGQTHDNTAASLGKTVFASSSTTMHTGNAYGGGVEYLVTNNISLKLEYLRASLNTKVVASGATATRSFTLSENAQSNIVRGGINYKIDFLNPPSIPDGLF